MQFTKTAKTLLSEITLRRVHEVIPRFFQSDKIAPAQLSHLIKKFITLASASAVELLSDRPSCFRPNSDLWVWAGEQHEPRQCPTQHNSRMKPHLAAHLGEKCG